VATGKTNNPGSVRLRRSGPDRSRFSARDPNPQLGQLLTEAVERNLAWLDEKLYFEVLPLRTLASVAPRVRAHEGSANNRAAQRQAAIEWAEPSGLEPDTPDQSSDRGLTCARDEGRASSCSMGML
jgi:hypothetical protein